MKFKRMAAAFLMSAFFVPAFSQEIEASRVEEGFKRLYMTGKLYESISNAPLGTVFPLRSRDGEINHTMHKLGCIFNYCYFNVNKVPDNFKKKEDMTVFDISDLNLKDPDQQDADDLGMTLADYKKMIAEDEDAGRIWQKIQLKKAEQLQKEKEEAVKRKRKRKIFSDYRGHKFKSVKELCYDIYKGLTYGRGWNGSYQNIEVKGVDAGLYEGNAELGRCNAVWPDGLVAHTLDYSVLYEDIPPGEIPEEEKKEPEKDHPKPVEKPDASNPKPSENPNVSTLGGGASPSVGNAPGGGSLGASDGGGSTGAGNGGNNGSAEQGSGKGKGDEEGGEKMPDVPKYGEPDWGSLKSDGNFGSYAPANVFSTGGHCMSDIRLDMGQFGNHTLQMGFLCDVLKKLRYVFIAMAYLYSAVLVFKTVNSLKG